MRYILSYILLLFSFVVCGQTISGDDQYIILKTDTIWYEPQYLESGQTLITNFETVNNPFQVVQTKDVRDIVQVIGSDKSKIDSLPDFGDSVLVNKIYRFDTTLVIARQSHLRTEHDPFTIPALFSFYRTGDSLQWIPNEYVYIDNVRIYGGVAYIVIQEHLTLTGQTPDIVPALWNVIQDGVEWQVGVSYAVNDEVIYNENLYKCLQAHTSQAGWQPPNVPALWQLIP